MEEYNPLPENILTLPFPHFKKANQWVLKALFLWDLEVGVARCLDSICKSFNRSTHFTLIMANTAYPLPDTTPHPGEIGAEIVQVAYLRGYLLRGRGRIPGTERPYLDGDLTRSFESLEGIASAGLEGITKSLKPLIRERRERAAYIERFIEGIQQSSEPGIQKLRDDLKRVAQKYFLSEDITLGLVAVHFFLKEEYRD